MYLRVQPQPTGHGTSSDLVIVSLKIVYPAQVARLQWLYPVSYRRTTNILKQNRIISQNCSDRIYQTIQQVKFHRDPSRKPRFHSSSYIRDWGRGYLHAIENTLSPNQRRNMQQKQYHRELPITWEYPNVSLLFKRAGLHSDQFRKQKKPMHESSVVTS